jgi:WW domain-containing oxidoreductase
MSLVAKLKGAGPSGFGHGSTAEEVTAGVDLSGQTMLVTGASSGLGLETLRTCGRRGARVIATARSLGSAERACRQVPGDHLPLACDLTDPDSVRACAEAIEADGATLDAVIANAGVMAVRQLQLARGYELQFFSNHIGHFLLITRLLPRLSPAGRVVMVSSAAHRAAPRAGIDFDNLAGQHN